MITATIVFIASATILAVIGLAALYVHDLLTCADHNYYCPDHPHAVYQRSYLHHRCDYCGHQMVRGWPAPRRAP
jgi:hypothetical protein